MPTTPFLRIAAAFVDATLSLALALAALWAAGLPLPGVTASGTDLALEVRFLGTALLFFAFRDVARGASVAKWVMGLRVETPGGARPSLGSRLARMQWALLPFGLVPRLERRTPWRVSAYVPSGSGLAVRAMLAVACLVATLIWGSAALRPSIGHDDAMQLAQATLLGDPFLRSTLGAPLQAEIGALVPRGRGTWRSHEGIFQMRIRGARAMQSMTVRARKVDGSWAVDEVTEIEVSAWDSLPHRVTSR